MYDATLERRIVRARPNRKIWVERARNYWISVSIQEAQIWNIYLAARDRFLLSSGKDDAAILAHCEQRLRTDFGRSI